MSKYRRIKLDGLVIDDRYQRPLERSRVKAIAKNYDENLLGVLEVSHRNGKCAVFDGQHRLEALKLVGVPDAPCLVHENLSAEDEARLFVRFQRERKTVHPVDRFKAQLFSGDARAREIQDAVTAAGYKIGHRGPDAGRVRDVRAVVALERLHSRGGPEAITRTLDLVSTLWDGDPKSTDGAFLEGLYHFFNEYEDRVDDEALEQLRSQPPATILRRAIGMGGGGQQLRFAVANELKRTAGLRGRPRKATAA
jgi:hypothetical protein